MIKDISQNISQNNNKINHITLDHINIMIKIAIITIKLIKMITMENHMHNSLIININNTRTIMIRTISIVAKITMKMINSMMIIMMKLTKRLTMTMEIMEMKKLELSRILKMTITMRQTLISQETQILHTHNNQLLDL